MARTWGTYRSGMRDILSSAGIEADMRAYAEQVADRARAQAPMVQDRDGGPNEIDLPIKVESTSGSFGARAAVIVAHPAGLNVEAKHALLARSAQ